MVSTYLNAYPEGLPIGGHWVPCEDSADIVFPFDSSLIASAPVGTVDHAAQALDAAEQVADEVEGLSTGTRRSILCSVHDRLAEHREELEQLLVLETGKPLVDCRVEVARTLTTWSSAAEEVAHIHGETVPLDLQPSGEGMMGFWVRKPAGIVVGIAGFNYPLLLASHKLAPAIAAGCPIILKPAPNTPLATLWAVHIIREALAEHSVNPGAVQLVTGGIDVGERLVGDPRSAVVSFTGSAAVGHQIAKNAAPRKTVLELGSNTGFIVAADASIPQAVDAVLRGGFYANGQACISIQRVLLDKEIAQEFQAQLLERLGEVAVGDPRSAQTRVAPVINEASTQRILGWINDAAAHGAQVLAGGELEGRALKPTVVRDVPRDLQLWNEEIFGPVICLETVPDLDTAFEILNDSRYGLQAAIYSSSLKTAFRAIDTLKVGGVVVNEIPGFRSDIMPYGGVKDSGIGREGPRFAIEEFTVTRMALIRP
ncbi:MULTISPECIES: aldehyde dehydrogenase family protein [Glutamicibacter]|uniref:Aldehyde dehydrogenase family protein n=1 Tax=Glutamicibacter halophytocola TaxID=1933880 RepID=A0AA94XRJ9_9MICC|nr:MULTISPECIES: aldehyde dehydrogenase family protein [Glutamicibacter]MBF6670601.1 aldehyde dehydrogenase family protein [Glutamicibacter sp. FBE19]UUX58605.1 aldehyde dehydrogenase family protein [Glutamicibacter halophytocola]